ncbi:DUF6301 family protein [Rhodococcus sp. NPDC057135]|uniref:DUF6301 family protein n=1 Tax=Rhodococcus sp. NPDC057135 TaxID=3346028 RepID=UPI00362AC891
MSESPVFDVAEAMRVAREAEQFEWSWSASNIEQLQSLLAPIKLSGAKMRFAPSTELDIVRVFIADIPLHSVDDAEREALRTGFAALRMDLIEAWGEPDSDIDGDTRSLVWVLAQVVVQLNCRTHSVSYLLFRPDAHRSAEAARRARQEQDEQRTDFAPFLAVLPHIANAHLRSWSRSDLDSLFEAVGWPIDISNEDLVAEQNGDAVQASLHASRTEEYMDADRWGFGEYRELRLSQRLSSRVMPEAYAAALRSCVELLGPPPVVGGPDAQAIWRGAKVTYTLSTSGSGLQFAATPTEAVEGREYWESKWDEDWESPLRWLVTTGADGVRFGTRDWWVHERPAETWSMLDDYITELFPSLAGDLALLAPYATGVVWVLRVADEPGPFVQGWFADDGAGLGIHLPGAEPVVRSYPPSFESGRRIAAETTAALRKFGVASPTDLEMEAWAPWGTTQALDTFRLGFKR